MKCFCRQDFKEVCIGVYPEGIDAKSVESERKWKFLTGIRAKNYMVSTSTTSVSATPQQLFYIPLFVASPFYTHCLERISNKYVWVFDQKQLTIIRGGIFHQVKP